MKKLLVALILAASFYAGAAFAAVNINSAGVDELAQLPGIGPVKAQAIYEFREKNGDFESLQGLTQVSGIGSKTIEGLSEEATIEAIE